MFFGIEVKQGINIRYGTVVDIVLEANLSKCKDKLNIFGDVDTSKVVDVIETITESTMIGKCLELFNIAVKHGGTPHVGEASIGKLKKEDIFVSAPVVFANVKQMSEFAKEVGVA